MTEKKSKYQCPTCGGFSVSKTWRDHTFPYGSEDLEFTVEVPVFECLDDECDGELWMNWEADEIRDAFVDQWRNDQKEK
jgi:hypothetical protein